MKANYGAITTELLGDRPPFVLELHTINYNTCLACRISESRRLLGCERPRWRKRASPGIRQGSNICAGAGHAAWG